MGDLIGIITALSVLNVLVVAKLSNLFKPATKLLRYGVALASSAITIMAAKFLGPDLFLLMKQVFEELPVFEIPDVDGLTWPQLGLVTLGLFVISGGGWDLLKSLGARKAAPK